MHGLEKHSFRSVPLIKTSCVNFRNCSTIAWLSLPVLKRATGEGSLPEIAQYSPYYLPSNVILLSNIKPLYFITYFIYSHCVCVWFDNVPKIFPLYASCSVSQITSSPRATIARLRVNQYSHWTKLFFFFFFFLVILVTCKNEEDPLKNKDARVATTQNIDFSNTKGQLTPQSEVGSGLISNSSEIL